MKDGVGQRGSTFTAYWWIKDPTRPGEYLQRSRGGFKNITEARRYRTERVSAVNAGTYSEPKDKTLTVRVFLTDHWLPAARTEATRSGAPRRETTIGTYETVVDKWLVPHLGAQRVASLTPRSVETALSALRDHGGKNGRALGGRSVQVAHGVLRQALDYGVRHGYVQRNVAAVVRRPGAKPATMTAWTVEEARAFLTAVKDDRLYAAWLLLLSRGPRRGELAGLRWSDVDLEAKVAKIAVTRVAVGGTTKASTPKTAAGTRSLSLDAALVSVLRDHRKAQLEERMAWGAGWTDCGLVFVREDGAPLSPESISQRFERLCKRVGARRIRLHDLRHTAASLALADGVPVKVVSEMLGHGDVRVTLAIYQHTTAEMHVEAGARLTDQLLGGAQ